jgi:corrinoid protein of di/trimethylamine methyltransferase
LFEELQKAILEGDTEKSARLVRDGLRAGKEPLEIIDRGCVPGAEKAGELFEAEEFFLPELIMAGEAMKTAMSILEPELRRVNSERKRLGRVVVGTVEGDVHDIGKSIVASMLAGAGFEVIDLGVDVPASRFLDEVRRSLANLVGLSALLTSTMSRQEEIVKALDAEGLGGRVKVMVGGAPVTQDGRCRTKLPLPGSHPALNETGTVPGEPDRPEDEGQVAAKRGNRYGPPGPGGGIVSPLQPQTLTAGGTSGEIT